MPMFNSGTPWDEGLNSLSSVLFPDPSKVALSGLYGAQQRREGMQADLLKRQMGGQDIYSNAVNYLHGLPDAAAPQDQTQMAGGAPGQAPAPPPPGQGQGPAQGPGQAAPPPPPSVAAQTDPNAGALMSAFATPARSAPTSTNPALGMQAIQSLSDTNGGGGAKMATDAMSDGKPKPPPYDIGPAVSALIMAHPEGGPALQVGLSNLLSEMVRTGQMTQPRANQYIMQFNPQELGPSMRLKYTTDETMQPVWDNQAKQATQVTHAQALADPQRYLPISQTSEDAWTNPTRYYDRNNPASSVTTRMDVGARQGGVQVTQNGPTEEAGGFIAAGRPPTAPEMQTLAGATTGTTPMAPQGPEDQDRNRAIDDKELARMYPQTSKPTDANMPAILDDPNQYVAQAVDEVQRTMPQYRSNRAGAFTYVMNQFRAQGRIAPVNRGTSIGGRYLPGAVTGQVGSSPDVIMQNVQTPKGVQKVPRFQIHILPPGQGGPGQAGPGQPGAQTAAPAAGQPVKPGVPPHPSSAASVITKVGSPAPRTVPGKIGKATYNFPNNFPGIHYTAKSGLAGPVQWNPMKAPLPPPASAAAPPVQQPQQQGSQQQGVQQQQQAQGEKINAPDKTVVKSHTTGRILYVQGGVGYPATQAQIQAAQASGAPQQ